MIWITGCNVVEKDTGNEQSYDDARKVAWNYLNEHGWNESAEDWRSAVVSITVVNSDYELIDKNYAGKEALSVSFTDKEHVVIGTPTILVDSKTNKVIGHMPAE